VELGSRRRRLPLEETIRIHTFLLEYVCFCGLPLQDGVTSRKLPIIQAQYYDLTTVLVLYGVQYNSATGSTDDVQYNYCKWTRSIFHVHMGQINSVDWYSTSLQYKYEPTISRHLMPPLDVIERTMGKNVIRKGTKRYS
jgi:hypothetical protein